MAMDDKTPQPPTTGLTARPADSLRELQERTRTALAAQRARMGQLEVTLTEQLDLIEGAVAEQLSLQTEVDDLASETAEELAALRRKFADAKAAWAQEREQLTANANTRAQLDAQRQAELDARANELSSARRDLETRQQALDDRATQLNGQERELRHALEGLETRTQELARQQSQLAFTESGLAQRDSELSVNEFALQATRQSLANREDALQVAEQALAAREMALQASQQAIATRESALQTSQQQLACDQADLAQNESSWQAERAAMECEQKHLNEQLAKLTQENLAQGGELATQLADARRELASQRTAWEEEQSRFEEERLALERSRDVVVSERDALAEKHASLTDQNEAAAADLASQLAAAQQQLAAQQSAWNSERLSFETERSKVEKERLALARERDELSAAVSAAGERLTASRGQSDAAAERDELQQKFDLALADMQRLRSRAAGLEQELASRPAAEQTDSVELVSLRAERDALLGRIATLEQQPAAPVDADTAQQIAELQRRFELAVEDVRDLKKQNTQLEAQLKAAKSANPVAAGPAAKNWEAVKKQLLASLESDSGEATPAQQKERSSIANTVRITDEIVATKDRQIAELMSQLASGGGAGGGEVSVTPVAADDLTTLIDADAVIQQHRERIALLEQEMQDKLRQTEMALSLERAKIAREQSQLTDLRIELEAMRGPNGTGGDSGSASAPKRRWLSKLGLGDDEK
jgi:DNA repair exonuclease SbcCD ATPase subunit